MPHVRSIQAATARRDRAALRGFIVPKRNFHQVRVPSAIAPRVRTITKGLLAHTRLNEMTGQPHHSLARAALLAQPLLPKNEFSDILALNKRVGRAKHCFPPLAPASPCRPARLAWADANDRHDEAEASFAPPPAVELPKVTAPGGDLREQLPAEDIMKAIDEIVKARVAPLLALLEKLADNNCRPAQRRAPMADCGSQTPSAPEKASTSSSDATTSLDAAVRLDSSSELPPVDCMDHDSRRESPDDAALDLDSRGESTISPESDASTPTSSTTPQATSDTVVHLDSFSESPALPLVATSNDIEAQSIDAATAVNMIDEQTADLDRMVEECRRQLRASVANEATLLARIAKFRALRASCPPGGLLVTDFMTQVKRCVEV
mmetsp:Transcript_47228/g.122052  ORF Transcript_47228/g.122052 Transcript_47228/m.122052 type:complete len:379 (-) Transcript_47228:117-1253(-)